MVSSPKLSKIPGTVNGSQVRKSSRCRPIKRVRTIKYAISELMTTTIAAVPSARTSVFCNARRRSRSDSASCQWLRVHMSLEKNPNSFINVPSVANTNGTRHNQQR